MEQPSVILPILLRYGFIKLSALTPLIHIYQWFNNFAILNAQKDIIITPTIDAINVLNALI